MTDATIEHEGEDPYGAWAFLVRARRFLTDARSSSNSAESRQVLAHSCVVAACDALLAMNGLVVRGSEGGHRLRLEKAEQLLSPDDNLFERLEEGRMARNVVSYAAFPAPTDDIDAVVDATATLVERVAAVVEPRVPDYLRTPRG